jgi:uncharacterized repeat protein (TIGR01451 family)
MVTKKRVGLILAVSVLVLAGGAAALPAPGFTELISVSSGGVQGNHDSQMPAVSADGRFVAFASQADNLVAGDTNERSDIFVRDRLTGTTERVSVSSAGRESNGDSGVFNGMGDPSISADGRFVVFDSEATNFAKGDRNTTPEVFVHDRQTGTTELVSVAADGSPAGASSDGTISDDGNRVAFISYADDIVLPDTNLQADVFVYDRTTGAMVRVSDAPDGSESNSISFRPHLDADGHLVAFDSFASNLVSSGADDSSVDVFVHDLDTGVTESISGSESSGFFGHSTAANITPDGALVVFDTQDPGLFPDANSFTRDVVLYDRAAETYEVISVNDSGAQGDDDSSLGVASSDGRYVAFTSFAGNLVPEDTNFRYDVFVRDRLLATTRRVSVGSAGEEGDLDSIQPAINADGLVIAFSSGSTTFVPESDQGFFASDVFVRDARPAADLALALADSPDPVSIRGQLSYTATITNNGPAAAATAVTLVAELPADAAFTSATGATCTQGKGSSTLTCVVGTLTAGSSATVTILVRPKRAGTLSLTASVRAEQPDPDRSDNTATESTTVVR